MQYYPTLVTFHIIFAGAWLIFFAADIIIKKKIFSASNEIKNGFISLYLQLTNLFGIVGSMGIAITGIIMVIMNPGYGFFDMSHAHWLATKQIIFVIILILTFAKIIPSAKKLREAISSSINEEIETYLAAVIKFNKYINILVIINFIFAITHRFYS